MSQGQAIALLMFKYADEHSGVYPTGASSTEIFQKLINEFHMSPSGKSMDEILGGLRSGKEASDPAIFWLDMLGKTRAMSAVLKPENVCWDVTSPLEKGSPDQLPMVFVTGYKVTYTPRGTAIPLPQSRNRHWTAVSYKGNSHYSVFQNSPNPLVGGPFVLIDGTVADFIPGTFDPTGKQYQQLTPDGPLTP